MSITNFLSGIKIVDKRQSKCNGELTVVKDLAWGTYIKAGGLPQSGGLARKIWEKPLNRVKEQESERVKEKENEELKRILILGLGGGGIIALLKKNWPDAKITGVDIDPEIVELGRKYIKWDEEDVEIQILDAKKYLDNLIKSKVKDSRLNKFDLIILDTYNGYTFPLKFTKSEFIQSIKKVLSANGVVIINRLYGSHDRGQADKFGKMLDTEFNQVERLYPVANIMFICRN